MSVVVGYLIGQVGEMSGLRVAVPDTGLIIGRDPKQAGLVIDHGLVSRQHAQIAAHTDGKLYLIDLQSRNGTFVNGHKLSAPVPLQTNDRIEFGTEGKVVFLYESADTTSVSGVLKEVFGETVSPVEWKVGDTILGIYEVTGILGQGGMGRVYKVHHKSWNMDLAVKSPLPGLFSEVKSVENFVREAETWVNLNLHPNILQCFYVRTIGGIPRIFSEYVPGGTLHDWIKHKKLTQLDQILDVAIQFAWGLHAAHEQGIVHQDVKPLNVLMTPDGIAKVSDFGLARAKHITGSNAATAPDNMVTMAGVFTRAYCSPEQARGEKLSRKTDIWSWGLSVLEMFTGGITWQHGHQASLVLASYQSIGGPRFASKPPDGIEQLLQRSFQDRPERRPKDMGEIADELKRIYRTVCGKDYERTEPRVVEHLAESLNNRAVSLCDLDKTDEAIRLWEQALAKEPHHPEANYNHTLISWRRRGISLENSKLKMLEVVHARRNEWLPRYLSALLLCEQGNWAGASSWLSSVQNTIGTFAEVEELVQLINAYWDKYAAGHREPFEFTAPLQLSGLLSVTKLSAARLSHTRALTRAEAALAAGDLNACARWLVEARSQPGYLYEPVAVERWKNLYTKLPRSGFAGAWQEIVLKKLVCAPPVVAVDLVHVSPDGSHVLLADLIGLNTMSGRPAFGLELWNIKSADRLRVFRGDDSPITAIGVDMGWSCVVSGSEDGTVRAWDLANGRSIATFHGHTGAVTFARLSSDTRFALTAGTDGAIHLWNGRVGSLVKTLRGSGTAITCGSVDQREQLLLTGDSLGQLDLWDLKSGTLVRTLTSLLEYQRSYSVAISLDGRNAVTPLKRRRNKQVFAKKSDTDYVAVDCSCSDDVIRIWDLRRGTVRSLRATPSQCLGACWSSDGKYLFAVLNDRIRVVDFATNENLHTFAACPMGVGGIDCIALSMNGARLISTGGDRMVRVWTLDWKLGEKEAADWDEGARPYLETFLTLHTPFAGELPTDRHPTEEEITLALTRRGTPVWSEKDFERLLYTLACAGYGWLRPEGVRRGLDRMAVEWER